MKKFLALFLTLILALSLPMSCFAASAGDASSFSGAAEALKNNIAKAAADLTVENPENIASVVASAFSGLTVDVDASSANASAPKAVRAKAEGAPDKQTVAEAADNIRKYMFIQVDDPAQAAALAAETCDFEYSVVKDGKGTVYISIDIEKNPEIFNYEVFRELVDKLYENQKEEMVKNADGSTDYLMSYEHIAGELALHMIVYAATTETIKLTGSGSDVIVKLYNAAVQADLNYNESRIPHKWLKAFGRLVITLIRWNIFKVFTVFG